MGQALSIQFRLVIWMAKTLTLFACKRFTVLHEMSHHRASDAYPCESMHMICFSENCDKKRKQNEKEIRRNCCNDLCLLHMVL